MIILYVFLGNYINESKIYPNENYKLNVTCVLGPDQRYKVVELYSNFGIVWGTQKS